MSAERPAVDPVYRKWHELEACDLEWLKTFDQPRDMLDDIISPREQFDWSLWLEEISAR